MARYSHSSKSLFKSVNNVPVFKSEGIGLTDSLWDDGTLATAECAAECMLNYDNRIVGGERPTPNTLNR